MTRHGIPSAIAALFSLTLAAITACAPGAAEPGPAGGSGEPAEDTRTLVETVEVQPMPFREILELTGETEPIRTAGVIPELGGRILSLDVEEGRPIAAGTQVLRVDTSNQREQIELLEVQIRQLDADIERMQRLIERGLGQGADLERLESQRDAARQQIDGIRTVVRQATTSAPISGIVTDRLAEPGEVAAPGMPVARIVDISTIVAAVGLPEHELGFVSEGMPLTVRFEATGREVDATLTRIGIEGDRMNRTFPIEVHVPNPDFELRAGMRVTVRIVRRDHPAAIVIPRDAVIQGLERQTVFVEEGSVAHAIDLATGVGVDDWVLVDSGLPPGSHLITRGHRDLMDGQPIRAIALGPCCAEQFHTP